MMPFNWKRLITYELTTKRVHHIRVHHIRINHMILFHSLTEPHISFIDFIIISMITRKIRNHFTFCSLFCSSCFSCLYIFDLFFYRLDIVLIMLLFLFFSCFFILFQISIYVFCVVLAVLLYLYLLYFHILCYNSHLLYIVL
jgi:hypothetical protein